MIQKFEEFIKLNESFQSSKLKEIVGEHGKPKGNRYIHYKGQRGLDFSHENPLYDLKDDEILGVVADEQEFNDLNSKSKHPLFGVELQDDSILVIGVKPKEIEKRIESRHKGNLGKYYGDPHTPRMQKKLLSDQHKKNLQNVIYYLNSNPEYYDILDNFINKYWSDADLDYDEGEYILDDGEEISVGDRNMSVIINYSVYHSDTTRKYGADYYDVTWSIDSVELYDEETEDSFDILTEIGGELAKRIQNIEDRTETDVEGDIYDYYAYYGVSPSDFVSK